MREPLHQSTNNNNNKTTSSSCRTTSHLHAFKFLKHRQYNHHAHFIILTLLSTFLFFILTITHHDRPHQSTSSSTTVNLLLSSSPSSSSSHSTSTVIGSDPQLNASDPDSLLSMLQADHITLTDALYAALSAWSANTEMPASVLEFVAMTSVLDVCDTVLREAFHAGVIHVGAGRDGIPATSFALQHGASKWAIAIDPNSRNIKSLIKKQQQQLLETQDVEQHSTGTNIALSISTSSDTVTDQVDLSNNNNNNNNNNKNSNNNNSLQQQQQSNTSFIPVLGALSKSMNYSLSGNEKTRNKNKAAQLRKPSDESIRTMMFHKNHSEVACFSCLRADQPGVYTQDVHIYTLDTLLLDGRLASVVETEFRNEAVMTSNAIRNGKESIMLLLSNTVRYDGDVLQGAGRLLRQGLIEHVVFPFNLKAFKSRRRAFDTMNVLFENGMQCAHLSVDISRNNRTKPKNSSSGRERRDAFVPAGVFLFRQAVTTRTVEAFYDFVERAGGHVDLLCIKR